MNARGNIIRYIACVVIVGIAVLTAVTKEVGRAVPADARASAYFQQHSEPDCRFEGTWHDWERDERITLGCLKVKVDHREGSSSSATGPRAISQTSMQGSYRIDGDGEGFIHIAGKDSKGKHHDISTPISVENVEYPTQLCCDTTGGSS